MENITATHGQTTHKIEVASITVATAIEYIQTPTAVGNRIHLTGRISGEQRHVDGAVLLIIDVLGQAKPEDWAANGVSWSDRFGPFVHINSTGSDPDRFKVSFTLPDVSILQRLGVRLWNSANPITLSELQITRTIISPSNREILVNVSVDVEALPHRAKSGHVDRLIFGRIDGKEYGIPLHVQVFRELGIPATFYLEVGECALWGHDAIAAAGRFILDNGFDLQLHLHAEVLVRALQWPWTQSVPPMLPNLNEDETQRAMAYAVEQYNQIAGTNPDAFRAGGYQFNDHTVKTGKALGIYAYSNYRADQRDKNTFDFDGAAPMRPFKWSNGLHEFPITISPEPLSALSPEECWRRILHHVRVNKTWVVNVVIHSWSFMQRDIEGYHLYRGPQLVENLRKIIALAPPGVRFVSMRELIAGCKSGSVQFDLAKSIDDLRRRPGS